MHKKLVGTTLLINLSFHTLNDIFISVVILKCKSIKLIITSLYRELIKTQDRIISPPLWIIWQKDKEEWGQMTNYNNRAHLLFFWSDISLVYDSNRAECSHVNIVIVSTQSTAVEQCSYFDFFSFDTYSLSSHLILDQTIVLTFRSRHCLCCASRQTMDALRHGVMLLQLRL